MAKQFWLSLPVKDLKTSKAFFTEIGFRFAEGPGNTPASAPLLMGSKDVVVMLCEEPTFKGYVNKEITDTKDSCEVLLSFDAASKEEADQIAEKAIAAGGRTNHKPYEMTGPFYGFNFTDPDGHNWNVLHMNM